VIYSPKNDIKAMRLFQNGKILGKGVGIEKIAVHRITYLLIYL
jgi:hypothetical protein